MNLQTLGVKLDIQTRNRLKNLGETRRRTTHWLMRDAIQRYLTEEEEMERRKQETLESWEHYRTTGEAVDHEVVMRWLNTWGDQQEAPCPRVEP